MTAIGDIMTSTLVKPLLICVLVSLLAPLQGCMTTQETGSVLGSAAAGAAVGALGGAALSSKGDGRRSDAAVRGALGGAAVGSVLGYTSTQQQRQQAARRYGDTECRAVKRVAANGRVTVTEECTSWVERPGYRNF